MGLNFRYPEIQERLIFCNVTVFSVTMKRAESVEGTLGGYKIYIRNRIR